MYVSKRVMNNATGLIEYINELMIITNYDIQDDEGYVEKNFSFEINGSIVPCSNFNYSLQHRKAGFPQYKSVVEFGFTIVTTKKNMKYVLTRGGITVAGFHFDSEFITDVTINKQFSKDGSKHRSYRIILQIPINRNHDDMKQVRIYNSYTYSKMVNGKKEYTLGYDELNSDESFDSIMQDIESKGFFGNNKRK